MNVITKNIIATNMKTSFVYISIIMIVLFSSCEGTSRNYQAKASKSYTKQAINDNIEKMGQLPWDKKNYEEIRDDQISLLKLPSEKEALKKKLDFTYANILIRDGNKIMDGLCITHHEELEDLLMELKKFPNTKGDRELFGRKELHDEIVGFIKTMDSRQVVRSFQNTYNFKEENEIIGQAQKYLDTDPKCKYIVDNLEKRKSKMQTRRARYCNDIVELYLEETEFDAGNENIVISNLRAYSGNKSQWLKRIEIFREEKNLEQKNEGEINK